MFDREKIIQIQKEKDNWEKESYTTEKSRKEKFKTVSGREIKPLYTPLDTKDIDYIQDINFPGRFPYTRGIHSDMYRGRLWTYRQFAGMGTPHLTNQRYKFLLSRGQTGLSVAFHMPTLMGRDSDDPLSEGEVGKCGVAIDTLQDMEILFSGIPLCDVSTSMTINGPAAILWAMYIACGEKQGVKPNQLRGTIQNDILKEYIAQKSWIFPPSPSLRLVVDTFEFGTKHVPAWNTISISGYHIREAGATALQELAFTLADGITYVEKGIERGLDVDEFVPRLSFFFNSHLDFFEEIAKYRAARKIWARTMKEKFGAKQERTCMLRFHVQTAGCTLTWQQPENNIIRTTCQALSAVLGGCQSLHTNSMDETYALPTEKAVLIALRTQQIIAEETGVINTVDPLGGSYFIEYLTDKMEKECYEYFDKIEKLGGVLSAIEKGFFQQEIANSAYIYQKEIEEKERIIVGVNEYIINDEKHSIEILKIPPEVEKEQIKNLKEVKRKRDTRSALQKLSDLKSAAQKDKNLMPYILDAVKEYATVGEITSTLKEVFGEYEEPIIF